MISRLSARKTPIAFLSKDQRLAESKATVKKGFPLLPKVVAARNRLARTKSKERWLLSGILKGDVAEVTATKRKLCNQRMVHAIPSNRSDRRFLSHMDRLRLFKALSNQPLPFLDIHRRFGITKQTLNGFVRRGLVKERWGQKDIGVRFKLTNSGRSYLKQLKAASRLDPKKQKRIFIRLRYKVYS